MRKQRIAGLVAAPALLVLVALAVSSSSRSAHKEPSMADRGTLAGGITDVPQGENDIHLQEIARFAVDENNKKTVSPLPPLRCICPLLCETATRNGQTESVFCCLIVRVLTALITNSYVGTGSFQV